MKLNLIITLTILLSITVCKGQDELDKEIATFFASCAFNDTRLMGTRGTWPLANFILDEANRPSLEAYQQMEADGYLQMIFVSSNSLSEQYTIKMLEKADEFLIDSINGAYRTIVYDSLSVADIKPSEDCYKISYQVFNMRPTPLNIDYYHKPERFTHELLEAVCIACLVDGAWQIYRNEGYKKIGQWHSQIRLNNN